MNKIISIILLLIVPALSATTHKSITKDLPLPTENASAAEIMDQVYFVNHNLAFARAPLEYQPRGLNIIVRKTPRGQLFTDVAERYVNTTYTGNNVMTKELVFFRYGKNRGVAMFNIDYLNNKPKNYRTWLPSLRKVRLFVHHKDESWGGTILTYGDVTLRRVEDETHEFIDSYTIDFELGGLDLRTSTNPWHQGLNSFSQSHLGKEVVRIKSHPKRAHHWYDHRISYVNPNNFADYRVEYFKNNKKIKTVDKDWQSIDYPDPRGQMWTYWYGVDHRTGSESLIAIKQEGLRYQDKMTDPYFWTESTIRRSHR